MWKELYGVYPLGRFYKFRCEFCKRNLAVFREHRLVGMKNRPIVLFLCSLADEPFDREECDKHKACYYCPIPKEQEKNNRRTWTR